MSYEEKKAVDELKKEINNPVEVPTDKFNTFILYNIESARTILNLIEKQSKEIEELKNEIMEKELLIDGMKEDRRIAVEEIQEQYFISKDKIKEILGIEEKIDNEKLLSLLQTIVDENARLEDIEDRKVQIEYNNVFNKGVKSVEDKIKAKIEEVKDGTFDAKIVLQSLLEKE